MSSNYDLNFISVWAFNISDGGVEEWSDARDEHFKVISDTEVVTDSNFSIELKYHDKKTSEVIRKEIIIPKGWAFDGASIPPVFWSIVGKPTDSKLLVPAMVHDWLYGKMFNRELSDEIFKELLQTEEVSPVVSHLMCQQ